MDQDFFIIPCPAQYVSPFINVDEPLDFSNTKQRLYFQCLWFYPPSKYYARYHAIVNTQYHGNIHSLPRLNNIRAYQKYMI